MSDHQTLQKAYRDLGMDGGEPFDVIKRRHKRLIMVWHPDRFQNAEGKLEAEAELKKINNAKDLLSAHFDRSHSDSPQCSCRSAGGSSQASQTPHGGDSTERPHPGPGPGPGRRRSAQEHDTEEEEARQRSRERAQKAAAEAAEKDAQAKAFSEKYAKTQKAEEDAVSHRRIMQEESLRWKIAIGLGAIWVALSFYGWAGTGLKAWWHDFSWKWERDHRPATTTPPDSSSSETRRIIPPYNKYPGGNDAAYQTQTEIDQKRRDAEAEKQKQQDIYNTRMEIDKQENIIRHCTGEIAKINAQLDDPSVSIVDKRSALNFQNSQKGYLFQAQNELNSANQRLSELTGNPSPTPVIPTTPVPRTFDQAPFSYQPSGLRPERQSRFGVQQPLKRQNQNEFLFPTSPFRVKPFQAPEPK